MEHFSPNLINSKIALLFLLDREAEVAGKITTYRVMKNKREQQGQIFFWIRTQLNIFHVCL